MLQEVHLTNASEQIAHALNTTATQFASHPSPVAASALPIASYVWICTRTNDGVQEGLIETAFAGFRCLRKSKIENKLFLLLIGFAISMQDIKND